MKHFSKVLAASFAEAIEPVTEVLVVASTSRIGTSPQLVEQAAIRLDVNSGRGDNLFFATAINPPTYLLFQLVIP